MVSSFNLNDKQLRKDLEYDNVSYRRGVLLNIVSFVLILLLFLTNALSSVIAFIALTVALVAISGLFLWMLVQNKTHINNAQEEFIVAGVNSVGAKSIIVDGFEIPWDEVRSIVHSRFSGFNAMNIVSSAYANKDGEYFFFFIDKNVYPHNSNFVCVVPGNVFDTVQIPMRYIFKDDTEDFRTFIYDSAQKYNIELVNENTIHGLSNYAISIHDQELLKLSQ